MKSNAKAVIEKLKARLEKKMKELPPILMNEGQKVFSESFKNQAWEGKRWKPRKNTKITRPILIGRTRKLINSVRTSGRSATMAKIVWGTYVPYAKVHNEGFKGTVRIKKHSALSRLGAKYQVKAHTRNVNMPKRQFMGVGPTLRMRLIRKAEQVFKGL